MSKIDLKARIHEEIENSDDRLLKMIYALIGEYKGTGGDRTLTIDIEQYNKEIDDAMKRMDAGKFITQEDLERDAGSW